MLNFSSLTQQLMLPQFASGALESAFNALLQRSPHCAPNLRKLAGKMLQITLTQPNMQLFIQFSDTRTDWLTAYEGEADCAVTLAATTLPKLADKQQLSALINDKSLILQGDIQVLQHFSALIEQLEKDPAELLSPFVGDVVAQTSTDLVKKLFGKAKSHLRQQSQFMADNLTTERPVLAHKLAVADFCDQVQELAQQADQLAQKIAKLS